MPEFKKHAEVVWRTALTRTRDEKDYRGFVEADAHIHDDLNKYATFNEVATRNCFQWAISLMWRDALKVPEAQRKEGFAEAVAYFKSLGWSPLP